MGYSDGIAPEAAAARPARLRAVRAADSLTAGMRCRNRRHFLAEKADSREHAEGSLGWSCPATTQIEHLLRRRKYAFRCARGPRHPKKSSLVLSKPNFCRTIIF